MKTYSIIQYGTGMQDTVLRGVEEWRLTAQITILADQALKSGQPVYSMSVAAEVPECA